MLGLTLFAILYLAAHVLAAVTGWRVVLYVGVGIGLLAVGSVVVALCRIGAARDD